MPARSWVARAGWVARIVFISLLAGCVGEIGESTGTPPPGGGTGGRASAGSTVPTGIGGSGNDSTGSGAAGTGTDSSGTGGSGASAGDGGGLTGGSGGATGGNGGNDVTGRGGSGGGIGGAGGRGGSAGAGTAGRGGGGGTTGRGGGGGGGTTGRGGTGGGAGVGGAGGDPFTAPAKCTSGTMWTQANRGSSEMNPGKACIACHSTMNGPALTIGGTVYPTAHEPDLCNGAPGSNGARVVITGADGATVTLTPGTSGNFNSRTAVKTPFKAKVTYMGRERAMSTAQTSGDCNSCHTQNGTNSAPGRILLP